MGAYKINGTDLNTAVGFVADDSRATSNSFERPHDDKPIFEHDYGDENGKVYDLVSPRFKEARVLRLSGWIVASSEADYKSKKAAFAAILATPLLTLFAEEVDETVNATKPRFTTWERLTPIKGSSRIITRVVIEMDEVMNVALPTYGIYLGSSAGLLATEADVLALDALAWTTTPSLSTGTVNRFFHLVVGEGVSIVSATNVGALFPDITLLYTPQTGITVDGNPMDVYTMEIGIPYSEDRTHEFELAI